MGVLDYDSILTQEPATPLTEHPFVVDGKGLADWDVAGMLRADAQSSNSWLVLVMLGMMGILLLLLTKNYDFLKYKFKDFMTSERRFSNAAMMPDASELPLTLLLIIVSCGCFGFIFHDLFAGMPVVNRWLSEPYQLYVLIFALVLLLVLAKAFLYRVVNWVFFPRAKNQKWMAAYFFLTSMTSFAVFVIAALYVFVNISYMEVAICLLILLFLYEILLFYKLNANFQAKKYGQVLIFLYFCAVEIVPLLAIWHFFEQNSTI